MKVPLTLKIVLCICSGILIGSCYEFWYYEIKSNTQFQKHKIETHRSVVDSIDSVISVKYSVKTAGEAKIITRNTARDTTSFSEVMRGINIMANDHKSEVYELNISKDTIKKLRKLGYKVTWEGWVYKISWY